MSGVLYNYGISPIWALTPHVQFGDVEDIANLIQFKDLYCMIPNFHIWLHRGSLGSQEYNCDLSTWTLRLAMLGQDHGLVALASEDSVSSRARNWPICRSRARISTVVLAKSGT